MTPRDVQHTPDDLALKVETDALISAVGGPKKAEGYSRPDFRRFSDYANPNAGAFAPIDAIVALEKRAVGTAGWPQVTREMARQTGHVLVRMPTDDGTVTSGDILQLLASLSKEASDVTSSICAALADGVFSDEEGRTAEREIDELLRVGVTMRALIRTIIKGGGE